MLALPLLTLAAVGSALAAPAIVGTTICRKSASAQLALRIPSSAELGLYTDDASYLAVTDRGGLSGEQFEFWLCDSKFMGTQSYGGSGGSTFFGQVRNAETGQCLLTTGRPTETSGGSTEFRQGTCSFSDDSSQLFQTFQLIRTKGQLDGKLTFINGEQIDNGQTDNGKGKYIYYQGTFPAKRVEAKPVSGGNGSIFLMKDVTNYNIDGPL